MFGTQVVEATDIKCSLQFIKDVATDLLKREVFVCPDLSANDYTFSDPLLLEGTYGLVPFKQREKLHATVAQVLEGLLSGEGAMAKYKSALSVSETKGFIASHLRKARDLFGALRQLDDTAEICAKRFAFPEVLRHSQSAVELLRDWVLQVHCQPQTPNPKPFALWLKRCRYRAGRACLCEGWWWLWVVVVKTEFGSLEA